MKGLKCTLLAAAVVVLLLLNAFTAFAQGSNTPIIKTTKPEIDKELFKKLEKKALEKVNSFNEYIKIITDKRASRTVKDNAIKMASGLFLSDTCIIEVSSCVDESVIERKIKSYLNNLRQLQYDSITISWVRIGYVSNIEKQPDGRYRGIISIEQTFTGFKKIEGKLTPHYSDTTHKNIEIILMPYYKTVGGISTSIWDVLLGSIRVKQTDC